VYCFSGQIKGKCRVRVVKMTDGPSSSTPMFQDSRDVDDELLCHASSLYEQIAADVDIDEVARKTEGYTGDDLTNVCRDASMNGMRRKIAGKTREEIKNMSKDDIAKDPVAMCDFVEALGKVQKCVSPADIEKHEKWMTEFGSS
jgi:SpoVK/Ycf46/Vps4 family AAA+-type ATPase